MFGNNNNNSNDVTVNTKIKTWYSELSCMQLGYWNENLSIKINPVLSVSPEGLRTYDFQRRANTAITAEKAEAFSKAIKEKIIPVIGSDVEKSVGISTGKGNTTGVFVEYKKDDKGVNSLYVTIYTNIGSDKKATKENTFSYKFANIQVMEDYNPSEGTGVETIVPSEFLVFYKKLCSLSDVLGTASHSIKFDNESSLKKSNNNNSYSQNNISGGNTQSSYSAPVTNFSEEAFPFN